MCFFFKHSVILYWELTEVGRTEQVSDYYFQKCAKIAKSKRVKIWHLSVLWDACFSPNFHKKLLDYYTDLSIYKCYYFVVFY